MKPVSSCPDQWVGTVSEMARRMAYRFFHNPTDAEDGAQEAILKVWNKKDQCQTENWSKFYAFCKSVIGNALKDHLEGVVRHQSASLNLIDDSDGEFQPSYEEDFDSSLLCQNIRAWLEGQEDKLTGVAELRGIIEGCTYEEVCQRGGLSNGNARRRVSEVRLRLRKRAESDPALELIVDPSQHA